MSERTDHRHLLVSFNFHPREGSEEAVGWMFARISAEIAPTVVYTQADYARRMTDEDCASLPEDLEVRYYSPSRLLRYLMPRLLPVPVYYELWHLGLYLHLRRVMKQERFSLCHVCTWVSAIHPVATLLLPLPTIWGPLGGIASPPFSFYLSHGLKWIVREAARACSIALAPFNPLLRQAYANTVLVLTAADDCRDWVVRHELAPAERVRVIPAITFPKHLVETLRPVVENPSKPDRKLVRIVTAARLLPWKGIDLLLEGLAGSGRKDLRLQVFGDGPDARRLRTLAERLEITSWVHFKGMVRRGEVLRALRNADLFALPSLHDSEAGACMEAAGLGTPVVALAYGGARSCMRGCTKTTFLEGATKDEVINRLADHFAAIEPLRQRNTGAIGNIPEDSLLLYQNKRDWMHRIYREVRQNALD